MFELLRIIACIVIEGAAGGDYSLLKYCFKNIVSIPFNPHVKHCLQLNHTVERIGRNHPPRETKEKKENPEREKNLRRYDEGVKQ